MYYPRTDLLEPQFLKSAAKPVRQWDTPRSQLVRAPEISQIVNIRNNLEMDDFLDNNNGTFPSGKVKVQPIVGWNNRTTLTQRNTVHCTEASIGVCHLRKNPCRLEGRGACFFFTCGKANSFS